MPAQDIIHSPTHTRPPAVAGMFYSADPDDLRQEIRRHLQGVDPALRRRVAETNKLTKALIAPHAGYLYSGPIAASAYTFIKPMRGKIKRVVLLGPAHRVSLLGLAVSSAKAFATPLGVVPVDTDAVHQLTQLPFVHVNDPAHAPEHGLEVHLPFLIETLSGEDHNESVSFSIVPLLFGDIDDRQTAQALAQVWGGDETLIVISSDLSHYLDYDAAAVKDSATADAIINRQPDRIGPNNACGHTAIRGLMHIAKTHDLDAFKIDLRNSGDTAGPRDRVVGYGAFIFN